MAVCLGIDYGTKRMGLAWADDLKIALPIGSIPGVDNLDACLKALSEEIEQRGADKIIIGYPVHMDGKIGKRAEEVDQFIGKLDQTFGLPVHRLDERLTSLAARATIGGKSRRKGADKSGRVDAAAACLILKDFLGS